MENTTYRLTGLKVVWAGMWLELLSSLANSVFNAVNSNAQFVDEKYQRYVALALGIVSLISLLMILGGLKKVGPYSHRFRKSRSATIWAIILAILSVVVIIGVIAVATGMDATHITGGIMLIAAVACGVLLLITGILIILSNVHLMGGCAEVAKKNDDTKYAHKCTTTWILYVLGIVVELALIGVVIYATGSSFIQAIEERGGQIDSISDLKTGYENVYFVIAGLLAASIYLFIIRLLIIGRVNGTYKRFNGAAIHTAETESPYLDGPEMAVPPQPVQPAPPAQPAQPGMAVPEQPEAPAGAVEEPTLVMPEEPAPAEDVPKPSLSFFDSIPEEASSTSRSEEMTQTLAELPPLSKKPEDN